MKRLTGLALSVLLAACVIDVPGRPRPAQERERTRERAVAAAAADARQKTCVGTFADCDHDPQNGCETDVASSRGSCGKCFAPCLAAQQCLEGHCVDSPPEAPSPPSPPSRPPSPRSAFEDRNAIYSGKRSVCARRKDGSGAHCRGSSPGGLKSIDGPIAQLAIGYSHVCALRPDGSVACSNHRRRASTGEPAPTVREALGTLEGVADVVSIAAGFGTSTCAVRKDGSVLCWGSNSKGEMGNGTDKHQRDPAPVPGITDARRIAAGEHFFCAALATGKVTCWGDGMLYFIVTTEAEAARRRPLVVKGVEDAVQLAAGDHHGCALQKGGTVVCWGMNSEGVLGTFGIRHEPAQIAGVGNAVEIACGGSTACVRTRGGQVLCWGSNGAGQLGVQEPGATTEPRAVRDVIEARGVSVGADHVCVLEATGRVVCHGIVGLRSGSAGGQWVE
jgi:alpha-tubulin suppressor-like RCC1 family protein